MKKLNLAVLLCVAAGLPAFAQVDMKCRLQNSRTLLFEPIIVSLDIINNTGDVLDFSGAMPNAHLAFDVEQSPGVVVQPTGAPLFGQSVTIQSGDTFTGRLNLQSAYQITSTGPYMITTRIEWGGKIFISPKMFLDILPGLEIAKLTAGIPDDPNAMRTYTLRTLNRSMREDVFLCITDDDNSVSYGVIDLGSIVRLYPPTLQADEIGDIHVLHQSGPWQFTHSVFTPNGGAVSQDVYSSEGSEISLTRGEGGRVAVQGGQLYAPEKENAPGEAAERPPLPNPRKPVKP